MSSPINLPHPIDVNTMDLDPHAEFARWFAHAAAAGVHEPEAVALATADATGRPSVRMVLLRGYGADGYVWFTNATSRKGRELAANPRAALVAHWAAVGRQVRIEGPVAPASPERSDAYFAQRDRGSQIGAWASHQSDPLSERQELIGRIDTLTREFGTGPVPRPPHWGGYVLSADRIEFWQHGEHRIHDRVDYRLQADGSWSRRRLNP
jgi:pyridoxamine 5'-phosphate oxidase